MTTAGRPWYHRAGDLVAMSPVLLWTLLKVRWWLKRHGLERTVDRATSVRRQPPGAPVPSGDAQRWRASREDEVICWWLVRLRVDASCLYRSLVMLERISRLPGLETIELVLGVRRTPGDAMAAHAWLVANGQDFRDRDAEATYTAIHRFARRPGAAAR